VNEHSPVIIFIQEHWLAQHEAQSNFSVDFSKYNFMTTSSDMYTPIEERILDNGPVWYGTAIGWEKKY